MQCKVCAAFAVLRTYAAKAAAPVHEHLGSVKAMTHWLGWHSASSIQQNEEEHSLRQCAGEGLISCVMPLRGMNILAGLCLSSASITCAIADRIG